MSWIPEIERRILESARDVAAGLPRRRTRALRLGLVALGTLLACTGAAVAAGLVLRDDPPAGMTRAFEPRPESVSLHPVGPEGGSWRLRTWRTSAGGDLCAQAGEATSGGFGVRFTDGFQELRFTDAPACGAGAIEVVSYGEDLSSSTTELAHTVVYGILGDGVAGRAQAVSVVSSGGSVDAPATSDGAYAAVLPGGVPRSSIALGVEVDGERRLFADYRPRAVVGRPSVTNRMAADDGGPPWGLLTWRTEDGRRCGTLGRVIQGQVGFPLPGLPGSFIDEDLRDADCAEPPARNAVIPHVATMPTDREHVSSSPTNGYVIVRGLVGPRVVGATVQVRAGEGETRFDPATGTLLSVHAVRLERPFAERLADRFSGPVTLAVELADGRITKRRLK